MPITVTFLELTDPVDLRPPTRPPGVEYELARADEPELGRWFYEEIGRDYGWIDRLSWPAERWREWAAAGEGWMATVAGERAGYFSLQREGDSVEIDIFGLVPAFVGAGIGGHVLCDALRRGLELGDRVWLHTCSLDHPRALPNYEARGMRVFKEEIRR